MCNGSPTSKTITRLQLTVKANSSFQRWEGHLRNIQVLHFLLLAAKKRGRIAAKSVSSNNVPFPVATCACARCWSAFCQGALAVSTRRLAAGKAAAVKPRSFFTETGK